MDDAGCAVGEAVSGAYKLRRLSNCVSINNGTCNDETGALKVSKRREKDER